MKWVKCVYNGSGDFDSLTVGKIYKVVNHNTDKESVDIINDKNELRNLYIIDGHGRWFEDVTAEVRNDKLNKIGI